MVEFVVSLLISWYLSIKIWYLKLNKMKDVMDILRRTVTILRVKVIKHQCSRKVCSLHCIRIIFTVYCYLDFHCHIFSLYIIHPGITQGWVFNSQSMHIFNAWYQNILTLVYFLFPIVPFHFNVISIYWTRQLDWVTFQTNLWKDLCSKHRCWNTTCISFKCVFFSKQVLLEHKADTI